ncbi:C-GCAxxG-C-C family protein [Candidatus Latescibacterota bacterium]
MSRSTCAEASLQGLLDLWNLPKEEYSWATGGYGGAIMSGETTCGLLIGSSIAIGLRYGQGKEGVPEKFKDDRTQAISAVRMLYDDFLKEFGSTHCQTLIGIDFSKPEDRKRFASEEIGQKKCGVQLSFVMNRFIELTKDGRI